ncbi:MAG: glutathione S-transferase family protein [Actinomycetota bacterium]|nr:glutathione S-transferase family protein [Actinomycetota bacterium]
MAQWRLYDYAASANCYKVRLALAQLGADYVRVSIDIFAGDTLTDAYREINPTRETPVLELDGSAYLPESGAILTYVAQGTPLLPDDRWLRAQIVRWLLFEQTAVMSTMGGLRFRLLTGRLTIEDAEAVRRRDAGLQALRLLDGHLSQTPFLVGDRYTIADIAVYGYTHVAADAGIDTEPFPAFTGWVDRITDQPGYVNDLAPYPPNASRRAGQSVYG